MGRRFKWLLHGPFTVLAQIVVLLTVYYKDKGVCVCQDIVGVIVSFMIKQRAVTPNGGRKLLRSVTEKWSSIDSSKANSPSYIFSLKAHHKM